MLDASYGINEVVVRAHDLVKAYFPAHSRNATVLGRLLAKHIIVNIDFELTYNAEVLCLRPRLFTWFIKPLLNLTLVSPVCFTQIDGYVGKFDLRDAGVYTLQVVIQAYFGGTNPPLLPIPIVAGTHNAAFAFSSCNTKRAMVDGGRLIVIILQSSKVPPNAKLFGSTKCTVGDLPGRWIDLDIVENICKPPYCTGPVHSTIQLSDWVRIPLEPFSTSAFQAIRLQNLNWFAVYAERRHKSALGLCSV